MSRKFKDGIIIDNSFLLMEEKKTGYPYFMRLIQLLAIMAGSFSVISILIECLAIPVTMVSVNLVLVLFSVILFFLLLLSSYDVIKAAFLIGFYGLFWYSRLPKLTNGFYIIENLVLNRMEEYYGYHTLHYKADYDTVEADMTLLLIMILIPMIALLAIAIVRNRYINLCNIILFLPVAATFAFGRIPSEAYLITYIIIMLYLTRSYISVHMTTNKEQKTLLQRVNSRAAIWLSIMCLMIFTFMKLFVTTEKYEEVTMIEEAKSELQTFLFDFQIEDFTDKFSNFKLSSGKVAVGGLNGGQLGKVDRVSFSGTEQLRVTATLSSVADGIYFKGYVGSVYTGDSWVGHSDETENKYKELIKKLPEEKFTAVNQSSLVFNMISNLKGIPAYQYSFYKGKIKVNYLRANKKYLYAPYYTDYSNLDNTEYLQDLYTSPIKKRGSYEFDYFYRFSNTKGSTFPTGTNLPQSVEDYSQYEKLYRAFVYETYTQMPKEGLERLKQEFSEGAAAQGNDSVIEKITYVKNYLNSETSYSLSPGRQPKGKDFVEYFLYENKVGYCSHYASAATLMLRAMGIPARYVEGYAVGAADIDQNVLLEDQLVSVYSDQVNYNFETPQVELSVLDSNAHAWVEVYIDGCGWTPMEFTPTADFTDTTAMAEDMMIIGENMDIKEEAKVTPTITPSEANPTEDSIQDKNQPDQQETEKANKLADKINKQNNYIIFVIFAATAIIVAIIVSLFHIYRKKMEKNTKNQSKKALLLYQEIEKIVSLCKGLPRKGGCLEDNEDYVKENFSYIEKENFTTCMETVRKARFGKNFITSPELLEVEEFHHDLCNEVYRNSHLTKRIYLKFRLLF